MSDELLRAVVGLPIALLWPRGVPLLARSPVRAAVATALTAALVLAPALPEVEAIVLLAVAALAAVVARTWPAQLAAAAALAALAGGLLGTDAAADVLRRGAESDDVLFVVLGALAATFVAGEVVGLILTPFAERIEHAPPGLLSAGRAIGWLERALVFTFLLAGEPAAAALALTAKSVARFPTFAEGKEPLAEYVLIGTLLSFALVTVVAVGTRALLGLPAL